MGVESENDIFDVQIVMWLVAYCAEGASGGCLFLPGAAARLSYPVS